MILSTRAMVAEKEELYDLRSGDFVTTGVVKPVIGVLKTSMLFFS